MEAYQGRPRLQSRSKRVFVAYETLDVQSGRHFLRTRFVAVVDAAVFTHELLRDLQGKEDEFAKDVSMGYDMGPERRGIRECQENV